MPYFSGPNGIRQVEDPGDRVMQAFKESRLARLYGDYYKTGNADLGQLARYDPEGAARIKAEQEKRGLAGLLGNIYEAPEEQRQGLIAEAFRKDPTLGMNAAKMFDPRFRDMGAQGVQSTFVNDQGQRVAIMRDGSMKVLGGNDMGMSQQTITVEGPNGEPVQMTFDKRTGNYRPLSMGGSSALGSQPQPINIQYDGPEEDRAAFEQLVAADSQQPFAPGNYSAKLPQRDVAPQQRAWTANTPNHYGNAMPGVGMTAADKAYAQEDAKQRAQIANLEQVGQLEAQNAGRTTAAQEAAKSDATVKAKLAQRSRDDAERLYLLRDAAKLLPTATNGGLAEAGKGIAGYFGVATNGALSDSQLSLIAGQLTSKVPRFEGPQSDKDVQAYRDMAGDLSNTKKTVAERIAAVQGMTRLINKYREMQGQQQAPASPSGFRILPD